MATLVTVTCGSKSSLVSGPLLSVIAAKMSCISCHDYVGMKGRVLEMRWLWLHEQGLLIPRHASYYPKRLQTDLLWGAKEISICRCRVVLPEQLRNVGITDTDSLSLS